MKRRHKHEHGEKNEQDDDSSQAAADCVGIHESVTHGAGRGYWVALAAPLPGREHLSSAVDRWAHASRLPTGYSPMPLRGMPRSRADPVLHAAAAALGAVFAAALRLRQHMRLAVILTLLLANWIAFAVFIATREPATSRLRAEDAAYARGIEPVEPAELIGDIATRPLFAWTGERTWIKVVETANFPALMLAAFTSDRVCAALRIVPSRESWVLAWFFLALSTLQWTAIGSFVSTLSRRQGGDRI